MLTSANMLLQVPQIGIDYDPAWESELIYSLNRIDAHTHDGAGLGAKIPFNNLDVTTATPNLNSHPLTGASYYGLNAQGATTPAQTPTASKGELAVTSDGALWYVSPTTQIQLATATAIAAGSTSGGFIGQYNTNGSAYYNTSATGGFNSSNVGKIAVQTYYFMSVINGTPGVSAYGSLAAQTLYLRGTQPFVSFYDATNNPNTYEWQFGALLTSLGRNGLAGRALYNNTASNTLTIPAFEWYETTASTTVNNTSATFPTRAFGLHLNETVTGTNDSTVMPAGAFTVAQVGAGSGAQTEVGYFKAIFSNASGQATPSQFFGGRFRFRLNYNATQFSDAAFTEWFWNSGTFATPTYYGTQRFNVTSSSLNATVVETGLTADGAYLGLGASPISQAGSFAANPNHPVFASGGSTKAGFFSYFSSHYFVGSLLPLINAASGSGGSVGSSTYPWATGFFQNLTVSGALTVTGTTTQTSFSANGTVATPVAGTGYLTNQNAVIACFLLTATSGSGTITGTGFNAGTYSWAGNVCTITINTAPAANASAALATVVGAVGVASVSTVGTNTYAITTNGITSAPTITNTALAFSFALIGRA